MALICVFLGCVLLTPCAARKLTLKKTVTNRICLKAQRSFDFQPTVARSETVTKTVTNERLPASFYVLLRHCKKVKPPSFQETRGFICLVMSYRDLTGIYSHSIVAGGLPETS